MMCEITWVHTSSFPWNKHPRTLQRRDESRPFVGRDREARGASGGNNRAFGWAVDRSSSQDLGRG